MKRLLVLLATLGAVQGVAEQNGMSVDQLRARISQDGMSFTEFRNNLRDEIVTQKLRQSFAQGRINVSEAEVDSAMTAAAATGPIPGTSSSWAT